MVPFIVRGLRTNVVRQFEENAALKAQLNQDSSSRLRTQSMIERNVSKRKPHEQAQMSDKSILNHENMSVFHCDLMETCIDMMAKYVMNSSSSVPKRSNTTQFLMKGGQCQSWFVGNKVVTITTSGGSNVTDSGLCNQCYKIAKLVAERQNKDKEETASKTSTRKRHRSAAVTNQKKSLAPLMAETKDDFAVKNTESTQGLSCLIDGSDQGALSAFSDITATDQSTLNSYKDVDNFLIGIRPVKPEHNSLFTNNACNCWCNLWTEIKIRHPTGTAAWVLRSENNQDFMGQSLVDIANLLNTGQMASEKEEFYDAWMSQRKQLDSNDLPEQEYDSLHEQHFSATDENSQAESHEDTLSNANSISSEIHDINLPEDCLTGDQDELLDCPLRRTNSSPDLTLSQQHKLCHGTLDGEIQQVYTRSMSIKDEANVLKTRNKQDGGGDKNEKPLIAHRSKLSPIEEPRTPTSRATRPLLTKSHSLKIEEHSKDDPVIDQSSVQKHQDVNNSKTDIKTGNLASEGGVPSALTSPQKRKRHVSLTGTACKPNQIEGLSLLNTDSEVLPQPRLRSATVSGVRTEQQKNLSAPLKLSPEDEIFLDSSQHGGMNPSNVFLQLYYNNLFHDKSIRSHQRPLPLSAGTEATRQALERLDYVHTFQTHSIGLIYVGPGQVNNEREILSNTSGSPRYADFLLHLGHILKLSECNPAHVYLGGLCTDESDGTYAYAWHQDFVQVIFHTATLMPNKESDKNRVQKKKHIGNDFVTVVYNDSGEQYKIGTIKTQFNYVSIIVEPLDNNTSAVTVQAKEDIKEIIGHTDTKLVSDNHVGMLVRQMAVHANFASLILQRQKSNPNDPYTSTWLERLRQIKRLRMRIMDEIKQKSDQDSEQDSSMKTKHSSSTSQKPSVNEDFTNFI